MHALRDGMGVNNEGGERLTETAPNGIARKRNYHAGEGEDGRGIRANRLNMTRFSLSDCILSLT